MFRDLIQPYRLQQIDSLLRSIVRRTRAKSTIASDYCEAFVAGDVNRISHFYSPDVIYMAAGMPTHFVRQVIVDIYKPTSPGTRGRLASTWMR